MILLPKIKFAYCIINVFTFSSDVWAILVDYPFAVSEKVQQVTNYFT